ncbi:HK97 gp10 family phage protein [Alkaliphilus sp. B6464]|uniref:HK97 gp10 family phage protein n=1 Tax=Alkaliphilus sp. B6464 TaxID=2731219 RepID=UPI001BAC1ECC|nr:HK97 gp10 family phage protein [Alkaliphilus sp. B6464]QUH21080.1 HK97 gp10 family phage protein [Alkaliphilus sp. B6464]
MAKVKFKIEGMKQLEKGFKKLGDVPQKHVTSSSRKGMNIALKDSKANAPYETGNLKKGIKLAGERSKHKGKKVYRVVFDREMNNVFQKFRQKDGVQTGELIGYYPVSQEYGFFAKNGRYIPGYRFISDSLKDNVRSIERTIVAEMRKKIDQEIAKVGLK